MIVERQKGETWGRSVVQKLANDLQAEFPGIQGFSDRNIWRMRDFYLTYQAKEKLPPLVAEIGWTHNIIIMEKCKDDLQREFYIRMAKKFGWSKNVLIHQIENQTYEKTLLSQTNFDRTLPEEIRNQAKLAVKDEYTFDFLELGDEYSERQLQHEILAKVEPFLREMGGVFAFVGKMQFYLAALDDLVRMEDENPSIGIILCKAKNKTIVEYALKDTRKPIGVATYRMVSTLPKELQGQLPSPEQVAKLLEGVGEQWQGQGQGQGQ